jgi:hypothetical protein
MQYKLTNLWLIVFFKSVCKSFFFCFNTYFRFYLLGADLKFKHKNFKTTMNFMLFYFSIDFVKCVCV